MTSATENDATCLRCGGGGFEGVENEVESSKMLPCSEIGCPNAIHEACVSSDREIDGAGKFCCLYCAHRRALARIERLRREATKSKELLSRFIMSSREEEEENRSEDNAGVGNDGGDEGMEEWNLVDAVATGDDESSKLRGSQRLNRQERVTPSEFDSNRFVGSDRNEKDTDYISTELRDIPERSRNGKATNNMSSESREIPEPSKKAVLPKSIQVLDSNQNVQTSSSAQPVKFQEFGRRRINWTPEELKALKEGVVYFSEKVNKKIPWRKILKQGKDIFHKTRTPDNLKDKWNVLRREALNRKKLDHLDS